MKSIVFVLDRVLKVYEVDSIVKSVIMISKIDSSDKYLNLSDSFADIWEKLNLQNIENPEFYLLLGAKAGFTDSRVIFMWIRGQYFFVQNKFYIGKINESNSENYEVWADLLNNIKLKNNQKLSYTSEPNIG